MAAYCSVFVLLILAILKLSSATDYCNIRTCRNPRIHTMCRYRSPQPQCPVYGVGLTNKEKHLILSMHNDVRRKVAAGMETQGRPGPQPAARYMPDLMWDDELATVAQRAANTCRFEHDQCRNVERFPVGQNIAYRSSTEVDYLVNVTSIVQLWYDEVKLFNRNHVSRFRYAKEIGHYTQMVWAKTLYLGCGMVKHKVEKYYRNYLVCNYGPAGNFIDREIYQTR